MWGSEKVYFKNYPGYLTTLLGPQRTDEELQKVAEKIKSANQ
jgi:hypothetical protein